MAPSDTVRGREYGQKGPGAASELHDPQTRNAAKVAQVSGGDRIPEFHGGGTYDEVAEWQVDAVRRLLAADPGDDLRCDIGYGMDGQDRKSTRLNSSHLGISYAVFCL